MGAFNQDTAANHSKYKSFKSALISRIFLIGISQIVLPSRQGPQSFLPFLIHLRKSFQKGKLRFQGELESPGHPVAFEALCQKAGRVEWVVYVKRPFGGPEQVLKYLARYTHRVAISNRRLLSMEDGRVTFEWKDYAGGNQTKTMTLEAVEFIRVSSFTCCPPALFTSVILAFWPTANERKNWRCAGPCWMARKLSANPPQIPRASVIQTPPNSHADVRFARSVGWSAYKSSLRLAFAYRRPSSQTPHDHRKHTVHQFADQFLAFPKGVRRLLSETVVFSLRKRSRRLLPHEIVTLPSRRWLFLPPTVRRPGAFPDSRQPDRHSIPIALGPAQFNDFYRQCPPQVFPTLRIFFGGAGTTDRMLFIIGNFFPATRPRGERANFWVADHPPRTRQSAASATFEELWPNAATYTPIVTA